MVITPIEFILKDGRTAVIRSPRDEDAATMLEYLRSSASETDFLLRYPEEYDSFTDESEAQFLRNINESDNDAMLVCTVDGALAGTCNFNRYPNIKQSHRAIVGIALVRDFWGLGIGSRLFAELIRLGKELGVMQLELDFVEGNSRARAMYEKMGFRIVGVKPDAIRLKDGRVLNQYSMVRKL